MKKSVAIKTDNLSKSYKIVTAGRSHDTLRDHIVAGVRGIFSYGARKRRQSERFWALQDVSFEIAEGEAVGIIGRNGAGKSTLLKILSRITEPTSGTAKIRGRLGSLLEVGTGFHYELSGRENIYLSGAILGMSRAELDRKFDEIVAFSEVEKFLDTPVKHYSSGMFVRLAFAVTAHLDPDILLIDEVLSVGDLPFQTKCIEHTKKLLTSGASVLFVSHNMFSIKNMCQRVICLSGGELRFDGATERGVELYEMESPLQTPSWAQYELANGRTAERLQITDIELLDEEGSGCTIFEYGDRLRMRLSFKVSEKLCDPNFSVSIFRSDNVPCCNFNAAMDGFTIDVLTGEASIEMLTPPLKLVAGLYTPHVIVRNAKSAELYTVQMGRGFHVRHHLLNHHYGVFHESADWSWGSGETQARCVVGVS